MKDATWSIIHINVFKTITPVDFLQQRQCPEMSQTITPKDYMDDSVHGLPFTCLLTHFLSHE